MYPGNAAERKHLHSNRLIRAVPHGDYLRTKLGHSCEALAVFILEDG